MEQTKKRSVSLIVAMILVAMFVLGGLFIFYWWTLNRGGVYAEKAMTAAAERDWDGAYAFAAKAERYGEPDMNKAITYEKAAALSEDGSYAEAKELYSGLKGYRDADEQVLACIYGLAEQAQSRGALEAARDGFLSAAGYRDALSRADACRYAIAERKLNEGDAEGAFRDFLELGGFEDAERRAADIAVALTGETDEEKALLYAQGYEPEELDEQALLSGLREAYAGRRVAAGRGHAAVLTDAGTVRFAGDEGCGKSEVEAWTDIVAVAAGYAHTLGLRSDGTVVAAGDNACGQCEVGDWTDVVQIACGPFDSYAVRSDGTVLCCGYLSERAVVSGWTDVAALGAGEDGLFAVRKNGMLLGGAAQGLSERHDLCAVAAAGYFPAGLDRTGTAHSDVRDLSDWTDLYAIDGSATLLVGLKTDGTLRVLPLMPVPEALLSALAAERNVTGMSVAGTYVLLLHADGSVTAPGAAFDCSGLN